MSLEKFGTRSVGHVIRILTVTINRPTSTQYVSFCSVAFPPRRRQFVTHDLSPGRATLPRGRSDTVLGILVNTSRTTAVKKTV